MMNQAGNKRWSLFSELHEEMIRLENENILLKEKIKLLEERQQDPTPSPRHERVQWVEIESGKRFLTKKELGKYMGMKVGTISNQLSKGTFPIRSKKTGRIVRFDMREILDYLETNMPFWEREKLNKK